MAQQGDFVVSRGRRSCLHRVGLCYRQPGRDFTSYVNFGAQLPPPADYDRYCLSCWPAAGAPLGVLDETDNDDESTSVDEVTQ